MEEDTEQKFCIKISAWINHKVGPDSCIGEAIIPYWIITKSNPYNKWYILSPVSCVLGLKIKQN